MLWFARSYEQRNNKNLGKFFDIIIASLAHERLAQGDSAPSSRTLKGHVSDAELHRNRNAPPHVSLIFTERHGRFFAALCYTRKRYESHPSDPSALRELLYPMGTASLLSDVQVGRIPNQKLGTEGYRERYFNGWGF